MDFQRSRNGPMFQAIPWYSNQHRILLVGEGNFSFAASLGNAFGVAPNMVATSLDSKDELLKKYGPTAEWNSITLIQRGALVVHNFDACKMAIQRKNLIGSFQFWRFSYIVFNFPHAGFLGKENDAHMLRKHRELVRNFFANAKEMLLRGGHVHVRHKLGHPYDEWKLEELAHSTGLKLMGRYPFSLDQFPGYQNCRGDGFKADESFRLGPADTYVFVARDEEPPPKMSQIEARSRKKEKHVENMSKQRQLKEQRQIEWMKQKQDFGLSDRQLRCLRKKIISRGRGSSETPLHQDVENDQMRLSMEENAQITLKSITVRLRLLKEEAIRKGRVSDKSTLQEVAADEVARLEKVKLTLGRKELQTLENLKSDLRLIMDCTVVEERQSIPKRKSRRRRRL